MKYPQVANLDVPLRGDGVVCSVFCMNLLLPFDVWIQRFRDECPRRDRLWGFDALGDECLRVLWQSGTARSCTP